jgi:hypothetical protein
MLAWSWTNLDTEGQYGNWRSIPSPNAWYCEFGWMFLYAGEFVNAAEYLAKTLSKKGNDETALCWLLESAWLGNRLREHADFVVRGIIGLANLELAAALCGCLAAQFANKELYREMMAAISTGCRRQISTAETDAGVGPGMLLHPTAIDSQKLIVRSLDSMLTGGKHLGLVQ